MIYRRAVLGVGAKVVRASNYSIQQLISFSKSNVGMMSTNTGQLFGLGYNSTTLYNYDDYLEMLSVRRNAQGDEVFCIRVVNDCASARTF